MIDQNEKIQIINDFKIVNAKFLKELYRYRKEVQIPFLVKMMFTSPYIKNTKRNIRYCRKLEHSTDFNIFIKVINKTKDIEKAKNDLTNLIDNDYKN